MLTGQTGRQARAAPALARALRLPRGVRRQPCSQGRQDRSGCGGALYRSPLLPTLRADHDLDRLVGTSCRAPRGPGDGARSSFM